MTKHKYAKGTQAMLDAAKDDATKLPFDTVFVHDGKEFVRSVNKCCQNDSYSVGFTFTDVETIKHLCTCDLLPAKKPKQKKWQNGTQSQLDNAKDDARKIPKKTFFMSMYGETKGMVVYRIDAIGNDSGDVLMFNFGTGVSQFMTASELEPINEN